MRVTTRITVGYGLLFLILASLAAYQLINIRRLHLLNRQITRDDYSYCTLCLETLRDLNSVEEYTWKSLSQPNPEFLNRLKEYQETFETSLSQLVRAAARDGQDQHVTKKPIVIWGSYKAGMERQLMAMSSSGAIIPQSLQQHLEELRILIHSFYLSARKSMDTHVLDSRQTAQRIFVLSASSALSALVLAIIVLALIYRSVALPLARLAEGTRALAEGKTFYRLDTSRNDEFSWIARDINKIILKK